MKIKVWGNATWNLLHTICEKIYDDKFNNSKQDLFTLIKLICISVPCPICRDHASTYLKMNQIEKCNSKEDLKMYVFNLHNNANLKAKNNQFDKNVLEQYKQFSFIKVYKYYLYIYSLNKTDDLRYSFRRNINIKEIQKLLVRNTVNFNQ